MTYIGFPICSLFFMIVLAIIYFSKKRVNYIENEIYVTLLLFNKQQIKEKLNSIFKKTYNINNEDKWKDVLVHVIVESQQNKNL